MGVRTARRRAAGVALSFVVAGVANRAHAEERAVRLELVRGAGAHECPDATRVWQSLDALFPQKHIHASANAQQSNQLVTIAVSREARGYEATFSVQGEPAPASQLVDPDEHCQGLADALAVALILRLDPEYQREPAHVAKASPPARHEPPAKVRVPHTTWVAMESSALLGSGLLGDYSQPSFGTQVGFAANRGGPGLRIHGLRLVSTPTSVGGGSVHVDLWAASLGPCWRFALPTKRWAFDPCLELGLGRQRGVAQDFPVHREATATWLGVTPTFTLLAPLYGPLRAALAAGGTFLVRGQRYSVDGQVVAEQRLFGPFISLGLSLGWEFRSQE